MASFVLGGTNTGANEISFSMTNSVTNTLGLIKEDAGRWTLTGTNRYTGSTTISAGTLVLKSSNSSPSYAISANAVLELSTNAAPATATYSGSGTLRISGFVYAYADPGFAATFSMGSGGTIDIQSGAELYFGFGDDPWTSNLADLNVNGVLWGAANNIVVDVLTGNSSSFSMGAGTVIVGADNGSGTYSGRITDNYAPGNFLKIGSGTQTLSGTNIYSGTTFVSNGTLRVTGSLLSSGLVEVAGAGTLGGNGSAGRVLLRGGTISPGLSPGILSVSR
jgi:fibronectin-binding autotransporter adhesin